VSTVVSFYFHTGAQRERFALDLEEAQAGGKIGVDDARWLRTWIAPALPAIQRPRADRLIMGTAGVAPLELAASLMFGAQAASDTRVFLHSLSRGLEVFADRVQLLERLRSRYPSFNAQPLSFEYQRVEGDVFEQRMMAIVDQQMDRLRELAGQLDAMPDLSSVMGEALRQGIESLPATVSRLSSDDLLHIVQFNAGSDHSPIVIGSQTLNEAALDAGLGVVLSAGYQRRYLDPKGRLLLAQDAQAYERVVLGARHRLSSCYEQLLSDYWQSAGSTGCNRRDYAAAVIAERFLCELLARRHDGTLSEGEYRHLAELAGPVAPTHSALHLNRLAVAFGDNDPLKVAGAVMIEFGADVSAYWLYTPVCGLRRFADRQQLLDEWATPQGQAELHACLSLNDHELLSQPAALSLRLDRLGHGLFQALADSMIALHKRNLLFALNLARPAPEQTPLMIDDALDLRALLDRRLLRAGMTRRWEITHAVAGEAGRSDFEQRWSARRTASPPFTSVRYATADLSWLQRLQRIDRLSQQLTDAQPTLEDWATGALSAYLVVVDETLLDAATLYVQVDDEPDDPDTGAQPREKMDLVSCLLERISGCAPDDLSTSTRVFDHRAQQVPPQPLPSARLPIILINHGFKRLCAEFQSFYLPGPEDFFKRPARFNGAQLDAGPASRWVCEQLLRLELSVERRLQSFSPGLLAMLRQVIDYPRPELREGQGIAQAQACTVALVYSLEEAPIVLNRVFIVRQVQRNDARLLMWSARRGLQVFDSSVDMERYFNDALYVTDPRKAWLEVLNDADRERVRQRVQQSSGDALKLLLTPIDGSFLEAMQQGGQRQKVEDLKRSLQLAQRYRVDARLFRNLMSTAESDDANSRLSDALTVAVESQLFQALLPEWMQDAPFDDLRIFTDIIQRMYVASDPRQDFMSGISPLYVYAHEAVSHQLAQDFPAYTLDPDQIDITATRFIPAPTGPGETPMSVAAAKVVHTETLTGFAISQFAWMPDALISVAARKGAVLPPSMTETYIRQRVHALDIGGGFRRMLDQRLAPTDPDYPTRMRNFENQMPPLMLSLGFHLRRVGRISDQAFDFIERIATMPDGIARLPHHGQRVILSPLQLVADAGMTPDRVTGVYLICDESGRGPVVLHALYNDDFAFKEYPLLRDLLQDLQGNAALQTMLLERVDPNARVRYDHGGFIEPHLPWSTESMSDVPLSRPGPVTVSLDAIKGNALKYLFLDTLVLLKAKAGEQVQSTADVDHNATRFLATLGIEQVLTFLPGKLGLAVAAWQSQTLFRASATSALDRQWGKALSEFSAGLGMLVSGKTASEQERSAESEAEEFVETPTAASFKWTNSLLTSDVEQRLQTFEAREVALSDLSKDDLLNVYDNNENQTRYVAIGGKVYQVQYQTDRWQVVRGTEVGPTVRLGEDQQWTFDLRGGLNGGGGIQTRMATSVADITASDMLIIEASGMSEIRLRYRDKARRIGEAHLQAKHYLETCLDNLNVHQPENPLHADVSAIIGDFFGVQTPNARLVDKIRETARRLFDGLMDASLSAFSSPRFVVGSNRPGNGATTAFVIPADPQQRIYLTERYFRAPIYRLRKAQALQEGFSADVHYRAMTLIHELSHLTGDTHDITYLESCAPFLDLLSTDTPYLQSLKSELEALQLRTLSHRTRPNDLFTLLDDGQWRNLKSRDGGGRREILRLTGAANLDQARRVFLSDSEKRSDVVLSNADSVALLVATLGRRLLVTL
jgi:hypothetical protein